MPRTSGSSSRSGSCGNYAGLPAEVPYAGPVIPQRGIDQPAWEAYLAKLAETPPGSSHGLQQAGTPAKEQAEFDVFVFPDPLAPAEVEPPARPPLPAPGPDVVIVQPVSLTVLTPKAAEKVPMEEIVKKRDRRGLTFDQWLSERNR